MSRLVDLREKVVIITGASDGIGAACAGALRKRGALLVLNARSEQRLRAVAGSDAVTVAGDITSDGVPERLVNAAIERWGRVDVVINNAGAGLYVPAWRAPLADARRLVELNFFAPLRLIQASVPHMRGRRSGVIVNVSSIAGRMTLPWFTLYSSSKFALASLSDGLRMELARDGIHVLAVFPVYVNTGFQSHIIGGTVPAGIASSRRFAISAEACAEAIVRGIEQQKRSVVAPRTGWLLIALAQMFPRILDARLEKILE